MILLTLDIYWLRKLYVRQHGGHPQEDAQAFGDARADDCAVSHVGVVRLGEAWRYGFAIHIKIIVRRAIAAPAADQCHALTLCVPLHVIGRMLRVAEQCPLVEGG